MALSPVPRKRYTSAVYEDKFFPEKNAAIPFKWETAPGRPKYDDEDGDDHHHGEEGHSIKEHMLKVMIEKPYTDELISTNTNNKDDELLHASFTHIPHAVSIYPLRPPPKLAPASPLRVKDLLQPDDDHADNGSHDDRCPLHAYHHGFPWFFRFWPLKASTVVPLHKSFCVINPQQRINGVGIEKSQASPLINTGMSLQGRSQSFSHAASSKQLSGATGASKRAPERRCNSFNSLSVPHHTILERDEDDNEHYDSQPSMATAAAAAMWAGACILAAAAVDNHHHHHHHMNEPCKVASKLRDLMQQSANFSELGLAAPLAMCGRAALTPMKRRTKSMDEEVVEAFLMEGMQKSNTNDKCGIEHLEHTKETANHAANGFDFQPNNHKLVKRKGFFTLFKNECIACLCPSSTY